MLSSFGVAHRYICLGKRALFLIDFEPPFQDFFYYAWIQRVALIPGPTACPPFYFPPASAVCSA